MRSLLNVPIAAEDDFIGSLNLASATPSYFSDEHVDIATEVAGQLAIAIQQARLYEQVKQYAGQLEQRLAELRQTHDERRRLLARLVRAQEEERRNIASDIHDDSIQKMAAVGLRIAALKRRTTDEKTADMLVRLEESVQLSIDRLRHLMFELWPPALERHGLAAAVKNELEELHSESDMETRLEQNLDAEPDPEIRTIAFRIIQEAISNAMKHANAHTLSVRLETANAGVHVVVRDDGVGMVPAVSGESPPGHLGLSGMRERADMAGGWLEVNSDTGDGTVVEFWLPSDAGGQSPGLS
jgi:signal transduction histidine kinase